MGTQPVVECHRPRISTVADRCTGRDRGRPHREVIRRVLNWKIAGRVGLPGAATAFLQRLRYSLPKQRPGGFRIHSAWTSQSGTTRRLMGLSATRHCSDTYDDCSAAWPARCRSTQIGEADRPFLVDDGPPSTNLSGAILQDAARVVRSGGRSSMKVAGETWK